MFDLHKSVIPGCYEIQPCVSEDVRGRFVKVFHKEHFEALGLESNFVEEYYSTSRKGVVRGLHFQAPPMDHIKIIYCVVGEVLDVVVDLRFGSPSYGRFALFNLSADKANIVYIPKGLAHGFYVVGENSTLVYKVSSIYSPQQDCGISWNSVGVPWPTGAPILSERDRAFPRFENFASPFRYEQ